MQGLRLSFGSEFLRFFPVAESTLEIGANSHCDVLVHHPGVRPRHALVERTGSEALRISFLDEQGVHGDRERWSLGETKSLGAYHRLTFDEVEAEPMSRHSLDLATVSMPHDRRTRPTLELLVGRGRDARRFSMTKVLHVGSSPANDIVLDDRAVSACHLRLEPTRSGLIVRDLGSRNGTWIDGVRVDRACVDRSARLSVGHSDLRLVSTQPETVAPQEQIVSASAPMLRVLADLERFAAIDWPLLIRGESGVGKEGLARRAHAQSRRANATYVTLNAACVPRELIESELFGHERGAFTGALNPHPGVFEQADGGTLFLDEIGELSAEMQSRLLRVLESWEVRRVGATKSKRVSVRLICATHRDLHAMVAAGTFRLDLYYRIARLVLEVPPLRDRRDDIGVLAAHFLTQLAPDVGARELSSRARERLMNYSYPGNARELRNVLGLAAITAKASRIELEDIDEALRVVSGRGAPIDEERLRTAIADANGNLSKAARALGIARSTLRDRLDASEQATKA